MAKSAEELKAIASQSAKEAIFQFHRESEEPSEELTNSLDMANDIEDDEDEEIEDPITRQARSNLEDTNIEDIFDDIGEGRTKKGDLVKYLIKRYGQHVATKDHPYSWEELKQEFGAGSYTVIARSASMNRFIKQESRVVAKDHIPTDTGRATPPPPPPQQGLSAIDLMAIMNKQSENARLEAEEARKAAKEESQAQVASMAQMFQSVLAVFATMNKPQSNDNLELFKMQMEMQNKANQQMIESQKEMFKALNDRIEKIGETKKDGFDAFAIIKMQEDARNAGMEFAMNMAELAEKKGEERLSMVEELRNEIRSSLGDGTPAKKSLAESVIENLLPTVAGVMAQKASGAAPTSPAPLTPQQMALMKRKKQALLEAKQKKLLAARNQALQNKEAVKRGESNSQEAPSYQAQAENGSHETGEVQEDSGSFGSLGAVSSLPDVEEAPQTLSATNSKLVAFCEENLTGFLGPMIFEGVEPEEAGARTVEFLEENGFSSVEFINTLKRTDLDSIAESNNLPEEVKVWLNSVYGYIEKTA